MKSLVPQKPKAACCAPQADTTVAQCCAKVSKNVAGCHD